LELFLFYAAQLFEVVVFSSLPQQEADQYVKMIDPYGCVSYGLYRFATKYKRGTYLKDISHLNRDPSKVLVVGHDEAGFSPHPENFIKVDPWEPKKDTVLEDLVDFLEMVAFSKVDDVRTIAKQFKGQTFPDAFEELQERLYNAQKEVQRNSLQGRIGSFFSFGKPKDPTASNVAESYTVRKHERKEMRRKEYARIKELMQKQLEAEMEREKQYYAEHKMSLVDVLSRGPPPPPKSP
jgi:import inner membrane translocase subunit TIM50